MKSQSNLSGLTRKTPLLVRLAAAAIAVLLSSHSVHAANSTWTAAGSGNWSVSGNWTGAIPTTVNGNTAVFNTSGSNGNETIYLNGNQGAGSLSFQNAGATGLLGGVSGTPANNSLALSGGISVSSGAGAVTIGDTSVSPTAQVNLTLSASQTFSNSSTNLLTIANGVTSSASTGTQTLTLGVAGTGGTTFGGVIGNGGTGGTLALTMSAANSTTTLSGANTYTGITTLSGGTLTVTNTSGLGANTTAAALTLSGGKLNLLNDGVGSGGTIIYGPSSGYNVTSSGSVAINVDHNTSGNTGNTIQLGALTEGNTITVTNGDGYNLSFSGVGTATGSPTFINNMVSGTLTLAGVAEQDGRARGLNFEGNSATAVTSVGALSQNGFALSVSQFGLGTLQLTGVNTTTGAITVSEGTISLNNTTDTLAGLVLNGGTVTDIGSGATAPGFTGTTVGMGSNIVSTTSATGHVLALGAIASGRTSNFGVVDFMPNAASGNGSITTTTANATSKGILGGWATITTGTSTDWAVSGTSGTNPITAYASYTTITPSGGNLAGGSNANNNDFLNATGTGAVTLTSALTINSLKLNDTGSADSLANGGFNIALNGGTGGSTGGLLVTGGGSYTISGSGIIGAGSSTGAEFLVNVDGTSTLTINSAIISTTGGSGLLTKAGTGTLILTNTTSNYQQATTIDGGILEVTSLANVGSASSIGESKPGSDSASNLVIDGGTLEYIGSGSSSNRLYTIGPDGGGFNASGSGALTMSGNMTVPTGAGTTTFTLSGTSTAANTLSGNIVNGTGVVTTLVKSGVGTWVLSGANTFTGGVAINGGVLQVASATESGTVGALGITGAVSFGGGTLQYSATDTKDFSPRISGSTGAISIDTNGQGVTFASALGSSNTGGLTLNDNLGTGSLTLSAANAYTGTTTVTSGTLKLTGSGTLGATTNALTVNGGTVDLGGTNQTVGAATLGTVGNSGSTVMDSGSASTLTTSGIGVNGTGNTISTGVTLTGLTTMAANSGLTVNSGASLSPVAGISQGASSALTVNGTAGADSLANLATLNGTGSVGAVTLAGHNNLSSSSTLTTSSISVSGAGNTISSGTMSGATTINNGGVLSVSSGATASGTVGISSGGTLSGAGTVGALTMTGGSIVNLQDGATNTLTGTSTLTLNSGTGNGILSIDVGSGSSSDLLALTGAASLGSNLFTVNVDSLTGASTGTAYTFISASGGLTLADFAAGTLTGTLAGDTVTFSGGGSSVILTINAGGGSTNYYYTGNTSSDFATASNYNTLATGGTPQATPLSSTSDVFIAATSPSNVAPTLGGTNASIHSLTFTSDGAGGSVNSTGGQLTVAAGITDSAGGTTTETVNAPVALGADQSFTVTSSGNTLAMNGAISGGHALTIAGAGKVKLASDNSYSGGTTVGNGSDSPTLLLANGHTSAGSATGTGPLTVHAGATIGGDGTSRSSSFAINGNVMVGNGTDSTSQTTITGATASTFTNANLTFNLNTANTNSNVLNVGNTAITFSNTTLTLNLQGGQIIGADTVYSLIAGSGSATYAGFSTFTNSLGQLQIEAGGGLTLAFSNGQSEAYYMPSYLFLSGDNIDVEVVPEPSTWAMMFLGLGLLVFWQRRKSKLGLCLSK